MKFNPYYAAYGSNLNHEQMAHRCPDAKFIGVGRLLDHRLVFRKVADIEHEKNSEVYVGIWKITRKCLQALDRYEGFPSLYGRKTVKVYAPYSDNYCDATIYFMKETEFYEPPLVTYYQSIEQGYKDCMIPAWRLVKHLERASELYYEGDYV
jgi:gamma-glutamylcyclotransferase (GGCT)/AIG2-like uncharacterized protein YtfP